MFEKAVETVGAPTIYSLADKVILYFILEQNMEGNQAY